MTALHPALVLVATALAVGATRGLARQVVLVVGSLSALAAAATLSPDASWGHTVAGQSLELLRVDSLSSLFGIIFSLITVVGVIYALQVPRATEQIATLVYAAGSLGVVFAGDWLTAFVFWEVMGIASLAVIWHGGSPRTGAAGFRYLFVHIAGGSFFFAGVLLHVAETGDLTIVPLTGSASASAGSWLILLGVAVNAAIPPFHAWLTDAYPEASVTGTVFLSAYTTKTAVYVLIRTFPGSEVLVWAGVAMALYGVVYAVLENDIRRLLGYHIVSQVGYMVAGVGMGTALSLSGSAAHAFCHILYKALLLMGAGAVIHATGRRTLTELGGIWRQMPVVVVLYFVGALSISGMPLFNGFISKSMIVTAAADDGRPLVELLLTLASIGTFLHTGLKLPYFMFFGPRRERPLRPVPRNMTVAMVIGAVCCFVLGVGPAWLYARLPFQVDYHPYTVDHVVAALQLLLGTGVGFWMLVTKLGGHPTISLDTDWLYRRPFPVVWGTVVSAASRGGAAIEVATRQAVAALGPFAANPVRLLTRRGVRVSEPLGTGGTPGQRVGYEENAYRQPIGVTVWWVVAGFVMLLVAVW